MLSELSIFQSYALFILLLSGQNVGAALVPNFTLGVLGLGQTSIPQNDDDPTRALGIATKRAGFQYGPPPLGCTYYPNGTVANVRTAADLAGFALDAGTLEAGLEVDTASTRGNLTLNGGFHNISTYAQQLYYNQWKLSIPGGEDSGILTNFTEDLQFSMERLSLNPFGLYRLTPSEKLPFTVDAATVSKITGSTLQNLQSQGRLFIVDHSNQAKYPTTAGKFGAFCSAYFYIDNEGDFMPLAVKTNVGSNLVYTPLDSANDWLLAKLMFNVNDQFDTAGFHFAATHQVAEAVHEAAVRTLSDDHPVMAVLDRLMAQAYSIEPAGATIVFNPGGMFDQVFLFPSTAVRQFFRDAYFSGTGAFKAGYLETRLSGLLGTNPTGPAFKNFPFYEDASALQNIIQTFITTLVNTYYSSNAVVAKDTELQAWFDETAISLTLDFPCSSSSNCTTSDLINILTHFAFLVGVQHHALNTGDLASSAGTLPFHPAALYKPIPTQKGVQDLLPFLPDVADAINHVDLITRFNRPMYESQQRTLAYAYADPLFLGRFTSAVTVAAQKYNADMLAFSRQVRARTFDGHGLSQGMPFIYRNLDPAVIPWFVAV